MPCKSAKPKTKKTGNWQELQPLHLTHARFAGMKEKHGQILFFHPFKSFLAQLFKIIIEPAFKGSFIGGKIIGNDHTIGISPPHIWFEIIGRNSIFHSMDNRFLFSFSVRKVIIHFIRHAIFTTDRKIDKIVNIFGNTLHWELHLIIP
jgi:hypothetical protein